jgi:serine protease
MVRSVARRARLTGWRVEPVLDDWTEVELVPPRRVQPSTAWDAAYRLRAQPEVVHAHPMFRYLVPENAEPRTRKRSGGGAPNDPGTESEYDWSLRKANVLAAWQLFTSGAPGAGVKVGHPDTGYTPHPELADTARVLIAEGYDYEDDDGDPLDTLADGRLDNPGHGTSTGSVILSGAGGATGGHGPFVSGAAPHALLVPIRTTESVVLFSMRGLRRALDHARSAGVSVISISLGGPFEGFGTHRAVQRAVDAGSIVVAAAGNHVGFVVFPALFDEAIAVAASNIRDEPWQGSSRGDAVDITAPGESVWRAKTVRETDGELTFLVERGNGTSYATATMAGIAALWVSYHGASTLAQKCGAANIARVFKQLVQATCRTPRGWKREEYGPGIVDAAALLKAPLPDVVRARKWRDPKRAAVATDTTGLETLIHLFPEVPRSRIEPLLAATLNVTDRELPRTLQLFGEEIGFQLVMRPALLESCRRSLTAIQTRSAGDSVRRRLATAGISRRLAGQLRG